MLSFKEFIIESSLMGTYSGMRPDLQSKLNLMEYINNNNIPNPVEQDELHTTILYSRINCPNYIPLGKISPAYVASPVALETWSTKDGKNALVLTLDCDELIARHNELMAAHGASYDYAEYKPHLTLSYDVDKDYNIDNLPLPNFNIMFNNEYYEPLRTK